MELKNKIKDLTEKYYSKVIEIRRYIHQNPELSFCEVQTSAYVESQLKNLGITYQKGIAKTGVVALIEGKKPSKRVIALRADMDALPVEEKTNFSYKSTNKGIMHACGHDVHTSSLLGVIFILNELKDSFEGTIKCIFQPGEEKLPGGAKQMIDEGVLKNPTPEFILAQHVYPELTTGKAGFKSGIYMASTDELYLTVKGKGGHGAMPEKITNTVLTAAKIITALQEIPKNSENIPTVLTIGKVIANGATNVIPDEVNMEGTFRTMDENWRAICHGKINKTAQEIASAMGATAEVNIKKGYPVLINHDKKTQKAIEYAQMFLGKENVEMLDKRMTSEDFAYFSQQIPATFYRLGTTKPGTDYYPLHSSYFNVDEESIKTGIGLMAFLSLQILNEC